MLKSLAADDAPTWGEATESEKCQASVEETKDVTKDVN